MFPSYLHIAFILVSCLLLGNITGETIHSSLPREESEQKPIVELMIICDMEFTARFGNDRDKMLEYWAVYMWDVNMKFKTISTVDISFRVTNLLTIQSADDQPFIERARNIDGLVSTKTALFEFSKWLRVRIHRNTYKNFDAVVLVTGAAVDHPKNSWAYLSGVCGRSFRSLIIRSEATWGYMRSELERALGLLIGVPDESEEDNECWDDYYIMSNVTSSGESKYFFSSCSSESLSPRLTQYDETHCIWRHDESSVDILKNISQKIFPSTLTEQCQMITNDNMASVEYDGNPCLIANCFTQNSTTATHLYPIDNTPCGENKFCFRGRCLSQGYSLQNVASGRCLQSNSRFSSRDYPIMLSCPSAPTPLDKFIVQENESLGIILMTPYSIKYKPENADKCLYVEPIEKELQFQKCATMGDQEIFSWSLIPVDDVGEFLLFHRETESCARFDEYDNIVDANKTCDENDNSMRWRFNGLTAIPERWISERLLNNEHNIVEMTTAEAKIEEKLTTNFYSHSSTTLKSETEIPTSTQEAVNFKDDEIGRSIFTTTEIIFTPPETSPNGNETQEEAFEDITGKLYISALALVVVLIGLVILALILYGFLHLWRSRKRGSSGPVDFRMVSYSK